MYALKPNAGSGAVSNFKQRMQFAPSRHFLQRRHLAPRAGRCAGSKL
jgi:hypothetical protein